MKKIDIYSTALCFLFLTVLMGCSKTEEVGNETNEQVPSLLVSDFDDTPLDAGGGAVTFTLQAGADWTATAGQDWCAVSPSSGKAGTASVTVTAAANNGHDERNTVITFRSGNVTKSITVKQKQEDALLLTTDRIEIGADGGDFIVEAQSNVTLTYQIDPEADWLTTSRSRGLTTSQKVFTAAPNTSVERRQANIIVTGGEGLGETVTVYQDGAEPALVLTSADSLTVASEGGEIKVELRSNLDVSVTTAAKWIHLDTSRTGSDLTYHFIIDANTSYDERNSSITFTAGDLKQTVTVTQKQKDALLLTTGKIEIGADGGDFTVKTKSNVKLSYRIDPEADWLTEAQSRALVETGKKFTAAPNTELERRQANIIVTGGDGLTETVTVYQEGAEPTLVLTSADSLTVGSEGGELKIEVRSNVSFRISYTGSSWLTLEESRNMNDYTFRFTVKPNTSYDERNASVTFTSGDLKQTVTVTQKQKDALLLSSAKAEISKNGGIVNFQVRANINYDITFEEGCDWIHEYTDSRALVSKIHSVRIDANPDTIRRSGLVFVTGGNLRDTLTVYQQAAEPTIILTTSRFEVDSEGGDIAVELKSNSRWKRILPNVDWLEENSSRALSTYTHYYTVKPNDTYQSREATILYVNEADGAEHPVYVCQRQNDAIIVSEDSFTLDCYAHELTLDVEYNVRLSCSSSADWLRVRLEESRALDKARAVVLVDANNSLDRREGLLTFTDGKIEQNVSVVQDGWTDRLKVEITHQEPSMTVPDWEGTNLFGVIDWGDGEKVDFSDGLFHAFLKQEEHTSSFDVWGADGFRIPVLGSVKSITIYLEKEKGGSVEDAGFDRIEWN